MSLRIRHNGYEFQGLLAVKYWDNGQHLAHLPVVKSKSLHELFQHAWALGYELDLKPLGLQLVHAMWKTAWEHELHEDYQRYLTHGGTPPYLEKTKLVWGKQ